MNLESQSSANALYWERVRLARLMTPEERMLEGSRMFDRECEVMRQEILKANPNFSEQECRDELRRRLREADAENEAEFYRAIPVPASPTSPSE